MRFHAHMTPGGSRRVIRIKRRRGSSRNTGEQGVLDAEDAGDKVWRQALADTAYGDASTIARFRAHWQLVREWNVLTNLTAIGDDEHAAWLHYRDSLEACAWLTGQSVVDFGSGAGFPGVVLAIAMSHLQVTLVEPRRIRVQFLEMVVDKLGLGGVRVVRGKTSSPPTGSFDHAVTRATFSSPSFISEAQDWLAPEGSLICYRSAEAKSWGRSHAYSLGTDRVAARHRRLDLVERADHGAR